MRRERDGENRRGNRGYGKIEDKEKERKRRKRGRRKRV